MNFSLAFKTFGSCNNGQYFPKLLKANFLKNTPCLKKQQPYTVTQQCHMQKHGLFLVGAFSFKEKSPTFTVASFFSFFFVRPQSSSRMYHFLQKLISSLRPSSTNANLLQRVPPFVFYLFYVTYKTGRLQRVPPFNFFRHCANFFSKIFNVSKESPLRIF